MGVSSSWNEGISSQLMYPKMSCTDRSLWTFPFMILALPIASQESTSHSWAPCWSRIFPGCRVVAFSEGKSAPIKIYLLASWEENPGQAYWQQAGTDRVLHDDAGQTQWSGRRSAKFDDAMRVQRRNINVDTFICHYQVCSMLVWNIWVFIYNIYIICTMSINTLLIYGHQ